MIRKPSRQSATRLTCGVLVAAASAFTVGVGLAGSANAAATIAVSAAPNPTTPGTAVTVSVTDPTTAPAHLEYDVTSGPDATTTPTAITSVTNGAAAGDPSTATFTFTPGASNGGTDVIRVFDAPTAGAAFAAGDDVGTTNLVIEGAPTQFTIAPPTSAVTAGVPQTYTIQAITASGNAANAPFTITATEPIPTGTTAGTQTPIELNGVQGGSHTAAGDTNFTDSINVTTDATGKATFTASSLLAGTVTVTADPQTGSAANGTAQLTVTGGLTGNAAVASLTTSGNYTGYAGTQPNFTVTAKDSSGLPVRGAQIEYVVTSGTDFAGNTPQNFGGLTGANGQPTGSPSIAGAHAAGTDNITFFVLKSSLGGGGTLPSSSDPQVNVTATFNSAPAYDSATLAPTGQTVVGGVNELQTGTTSAGFKVTVLNTVGGVETPVPNEVVTFSATGTALGSPATPVVQTATTNASGVATTSFTPTDSTNGKQITVSATIAPIDVAHPAVTPASVTDTFTTPAATSFTLTPASQSVNAGSAVSVNAKVTDQYGNGVSGDVISFGVTGRNPTTSNSQVTTNSSGVATFTYTDKGTFSLDDRITATDLTEALGGPDTATVHYPAGGVTPANETLAGTFNNAAAAPVTTGGTANVTDGTTNTAGAGATFNYHLVTATVTNTNGLAIANAPVVFTVSQGFVVAPAAGGGVPSATTTPTTTTVTVNTSDTGVATAYVGSSKSGTQTITATAGSVSKTVTESYTAGIAAQVVMSPATASIQPSQAEKFTATVEDAFGNGIAGQTVAFTATGAGTFGGSSSVQGFTAADGTAAVTLSLPAGAAVGGTGAVTATAATPGGPTATSSASATYTVANPNQPSNLALKVVGTLTKGKGGQVTATVTTASGGPAVGVPVVFKTTGAALVTGTAATGANGVATFALTPPTAGSITITAYADSNTNGTQDSGEPSGTVTAKVSSGAKPSETPTVTLQSHTKGWVHITIKTHPVNHVSRVNIFQVIGGKKVLKRQVRTNNAGVATFTFKGLKRGSKVTYTARSLNPNYVQHFAHAKSIRVKK